MEFQEDSNDKGQRKTRNKQVYFNPIDYMNFRITKMVDFTIKSSLLDYFGLSFVLLNIFIVNCLYFGIGLGTLISAQGSLFTTIYSLILAYLSGGSLALLYKLRVTPSGSPEQILNLESKEQEI